MADRVKGSSTVDKYSKNSEKYSKNSESLKSRVIDMSTGILSIMEFRSEIKFWLFSVVLCELNKWRDYSGCIRYTGMGITHISKVK